MQKSLDTVYNLKEPPARKKAGRPSIKQSEQLTELILAEARKLFMQQGFSKTNLDRIVARLHLSKRTIYARFPSKLDLFLAVAEQVMEDHISGLEKLGSSEQTPQQQLQQFALELGRRLTQSELIALERAIMAEAYASSDLSARIHACITPPTIEMVAKILARINPQRQNDGKRLLEDAEIFVSMVTLHLLHHKALNIDEPYFTEKDQRLLERRVNIFLGGYSME